MSTFPTPSAKLVSIAEDLLVRLESESVAVRLNLLGQPGDSPDFVVAAWVLPYVYALRGDRDWRRIPQLTGSRQVSQLAIQAYKQLETGDATITQLRHSLGREVSESAVLRAITELWQQLRIIPVISAPGKAPQWQLLRLRYQKAIAEGASTSQVTAISVLASIYLQAVIAASMEEVEMFLAPLTARSKVREVLRGLVATRQVHSLALGHAPHFYVAGTLPEFRRASHDLTPARPCRLPRTSSAPMSTRNRRASRCSPGLLLRCPSSVRLRASAAAQAGRARNRAVLAASRQRAGFAASLQPSACPARDRKPAQSSASGRVARRASRDARSASPRSNSSSRHAQISRWTKSAPKNGHGTGHGNGREAEMASATRLTPPRAQPAETVSMRTAAPVRPMVRRTACTRRSRPQQELCAMATPPMERPAQSLSPGAPTFPARVRVPMPAAAASRLWQPLQKQAIVRDTALPLPPIGDRKKPNERTQMSETG